MQKLAYITGLIWDGADDNRLFVSDYPCVNASQMSRKEYKAMEKDINSFELKGAGFTVYCWNDCSGYDYWRDFEENGDNYCMVTANIENINEVSVAELKQAMDTALDHFMQYENMRAY